MKELTIKGTRQNPNIILSKEKNIFEFSGQSLPENVQKLYQPILSWIDEYSDAPNDNTSLIFRMKYYNSASSKVLFEVLKKFNLIFKKGKNVKVEWFFKEEDEDMQESGKYYEELLDMPFNFHTL
ncbi:MAG: DUF1987 domain-containing protein [Bacteroidales bacterium]|nr:DUF1987 domain-containing protein [Bacteroidales bacterium]